MNLEVKTGDTIAARLKHPENTPRLECNIIGEVLKLTTDPGFDFDDPDYDAYVVKTESGENVTVSTRSREISIIET